MKFEVVCLRPLSELSEGGEWMELTVLAGRRNARLASSSFWLIDCSVEEDTTEEEEDILGEDDTTTEDEEDIRDLNLERPRRALERVSGAPGLLVGRPEPRPTFTLFIFRFLSSSMVGRGVVVVFMVGSTSRSVMCLGFSPGSWSSTPFPPQFFTQFSPVMKLLPFPPHPLNLNLLQSWSAGSK